ncbi:hypothetical protein [Streptomyces laurentii]|uniref:hypothetical protein n=1 Tax=Streptomyces laurentii TaxID=39478 RepID=UPI0033F0818D
MTRRDASSALYPFHEEPMVTLVPLRRMHLSSEAEEVYVSAADLAMLAATPDAASRLRARRGFLGDTSANLQLREIARRCPEEFGAVGTIVLGAGSVLTTAAPEEGRPFNEVLHAYGVECFDGFQRLRIIAEEMATTHDPGRLARATFRVEIHHGPDRDAVRRLHCVAGRLVNEPTAQDGLLRCPNIRGLMDADWEGVGSFHPQRGVVVGPRRDLLTMPTVTRALACLSGASTPEAAYLAATEGGLQELWGAIGSPLYLSVFHDRVIPLGVKRAVEAWERARKALDDMPASKKTGLGHLIKYAPDLICWSACRAVLPPEQLHRAKSKFDWHRAIHDQLPAATQRVAGELVQRYGDVRNARGGKGTYVQQLDQYDVWLDILAPGM